MNTSYESLIEKLLDLQTYKLSATHPDLLIDRDQAIAIVREHQTEGLNRSNSTGLESDGCSGYSATDEQGRPLTYWGGLAHVNQREIPVVDVMTLIRQAVEKGNDEYWRPSNEHDAALREWKLGGFKGKRPERKQENNGSIIDCISASVNQILSPYLRSPVPVSVSLKAFCELLHKQFQMGNWNIGGSEWEQNLFTKKVKAVLDAAGVKYVD
jgi:hypothetical protein